MGNGLKKWLKHGCFEGLHLAVPFGIGGILMKWQLYKDIFDAELYSQMVSLIYRLSAKNDKYFIMNEIEDHSFFWEEPEKGMEDAYGLRYPGEVLERLGEKREITIIELRSLALALAETREMQEDGMFIGNQLSGFWKRLQRTGQADDPYLMGIYYLYNDKQKKELYEKLLNYDCCSLGELLYILYVLPDDDRCWERFRLKLEYFLGKGREIDVYEDWEVYLWVLERYQKRMQAYRKKDMTALKYLLKLPCSYAKEGSTGRKRLLEQGYSVKEIMFLSMTLLRESNVPKKLKIDRLTAERMAVETCIRFLNEPEDQPDIAYQLCDWIFKYYDHYRIKLEGEYRIYDSLRYALHVESIKTYQFLFNYERNGTAEWYYIDLTDSKWDPLFEWMDRKKFDGYVTETLYGKPFTKNEVLLFLERYEVLTGESYQSNFWRNKSSLLQGVFRKLTEMELLVPSELLEDYISEYKEDPEKTREKWEFMSSYLKNYMNGISIPDAYQMLKRLIDEFGVVEKNGLFSTQRLLFSSVKIHDYGCDRYQNMDLIRPFLSADEHRQLFLWIEQYIFKNDTRNHVSFLTHILLNGDNLLWLSKQDAKDIFLQLQGEIATYALHTLRRTYLSEKELEAYKDQMRIRQERHDLMVLREKTKNTKQIFTKTVAKCRGTEKHFKGIRESMESYPKEICFPIAASYVRNYFAKTNEVNICKHEFKELLLMLAELMIEDELELERIKRIINSVKIKEAQDEAA